MRNITLQLSSWAGISLGAEHYYGELISYTKDGRYSEEIQRPMTTKEAKKINKKDDWFYKEGDKLTRFETKEEVEKLAIIQAKKLLKDIGILIVGRSAVAEPQKVIYCTSKEDMKRINELAKRNSKLDWDIVLDEKEKSEICEEWENIIKKYDSVKN